MVDTNSNSPSSIAFNAHHSPVGAFASFTLGYPGASGGFGLELGKPADQHIFIGAESAKAAGTFELLPFFGEMENEQDQFVLDSQGDTVRKARVSAVPWSAVTRRFRPCTDSWSAGDLTFTVFSPAWPLPDPADGDPDALKTRLLPAVFAELTLDNRQGDRDRRVFFGYQPDNHAHHIRENWNLGEEGICSLCDGSHYGVATAHPGSGTALHFDLQTILGERDRERFHFGNATTGIVDWIAPAGERVTVPLVIGFHRAGVVTSGLACQYFYTRYFKTLDEVLQYGVDHFEIYKQAAVEMDAQWDSAELSESQRFHIAHSIRSYYGSTQLLDHQGSPLWVINEGEYRMMNTLDLTADQLFFELRQNPWTTRNVLDHYLRRYSYRDEVVFPGETEAHPGGLSFCHDMGVMNCFTRPGTSCYELSGLKGCFSYMTHEELVNWSCCAAAYCHSTGDRTWRAQNVDVFEACLDSLVNRDHPVPGSRTGIMKLDSTRTRGGAEITTYDSLDESLGQSRGNTYLAVKTWATYLAFESLFLTEGREDLVAVCRDQANRVMQSLLKAVRSDGTIPAVLEGDHSSVIIPIIEGLVFLRFTGREDVLKEDSPYAPLVAALKTHFIAVLKPGVCLFEDGAWKLSSTSINSWLSKIYLCQYVARDILGITGPAVEAAADKAHQAWLTGHPNAYWAWGDQFYSGDLKGSKYYPRGVTSCLWLPEPQVGSLS